MKYAKFNHEGRLILLTENVPGLDLTGFTPVADDADVNNLFLHPNGKAGPREELVINCDRTVLVNDGDDTATLSGLPLRCSLTINGSPTIVEGPEYKVSTTRDLIIIAPDGAFFGNTVMIRAASKEVLLDDVRATRDTLLTACDWTQMPDAALDDDKKEQWRNYRTALRNITSDQPNANVDTVIWPTKP